MKTCAKLNDFRSEIWFARVWAEGQTLDLEQAIQAAQTTRDDTASDHQRVRSGKIEDFPLTRRELEVARLVAQGYTDRQIAEDLFLSVGTVGVHVHHILRKLELRSRFEVAAWLQAHDPGNTAA